MTTVNFKDVMELGFPKHTARSIIKQAKIQLVNRGLTLYTNNRIGTVPREIVEEILGIQSVSYTHLTLPTNREV